MDSQIIGTPLSVLELTLTAEDAVIVEAGVTAWLDRSVGMRTTAMGQGGLFGAIKRSLGGGGWFWTELRGPGRVGIAATLPGAIEPVPLAEGSEVLAYRHAFLAGTAGITVSLGFQKRLGAGLFGGDGFVLQRLTGPGTAWVQLGGSLVSYDLGPGEVLRVHPQHVGLFDAHMPFKIVTVPGIKNKIFGQEGLFFAELTGPGRVWCQSMALEQLAADLLPYFSAPSH